MGADIHVVVEYDKTPAFGHPLGAAFMEWPRQTALFVSMAGLWGNPCPVPARGFPRPASWMASTLFGLRVIDAGDIEAALAMPSITQDEALACVEAGTSSFLAHLKDTVSNPAYSDAGWLTREELQTCIAHSGVEQVSLECELALELMQSIEHKGWHPRIVFWFDL